MQGAAVFASLRVATRDVGCVLHYPLQRFDLPCVEGVLGFGWVTSLGACCVTAKPYPMYVMWSWQGVLICFGPPDVHARCWNRYQVMSAIMLRAWNMLFSILLELVALTAAGVLLFQDCTFVASALSVWCFCSMKSTTRNADEQVPWIHSVFFVYVLWRLIRSHRFVSSARGCVVACIIMLLLFLCVFSCQCIAEFWKNVCVGLSWGPCDRGSWRCEGCSCIAFCFEILFVWWNMQLYDDITEPASAIESEAEGLHKAHLPAFKLQIFNA